MTFNIFHKDYSKNYNQTFFVYKKIKIDLFFTKTEMKELAPDTQPSE